MGGIKTFIPDNRKARDFREHCGNTVALCYDMPKRRTLPTEHCSIVWGGTNLHELAPSGCKANAVLNPSLTSYQQTIEGKTLHQIQKNKKTLLEINDVFHGNNDSLTITPASKEVRTLQFYTPACFSTRSNWVPRCIELSLAVLQTSLLQYLQTSESKK